MFERFTKEAKMAVVLAQEVARETHAPTIGTEHLALAVLKGDGPAVQALGAAGLATDVLTQRLTQLARGSGLDEEALASLGIDLEAVRRTADETFGDDALERAGLIARLRGRKRGHLPFTTEAKKILQISLREAIRLGDKEITDRHLILATLRAGGPISDVLVGQADRGALRQALEAPPRAA